MMTKLEAVKELRTYDHAFLSPDGIKELGEPFGFYKTTMATVDWTDPKGLYVDGMETGEKVEGLDAAYMAEQLAKLEGLVIGKDFPDCNGRGSRLRCACDALIKHLS